MKFWKYSGTYLALTGGLHTLVAIWLGWQPFQEMFQDGLINSVGDDLQKSFMLWFLICGILLILLGQTLQHYLNKEQKPAPLSLGYAMLIFAIAGCLIEPFSGFWLFIPQALIILFAKRKIS